MELRPVQTALLAGRLASRWASSTNPASSRSAPAFLCPSALHRHFSTTRPLLQEAEAAAPAPSPPAPAPNAMPSSMVDAVKQQLQRQQQQQQQQQQQSQAAQQQQQPQQPSTVPTRRPSLFGNPSSSSAPPPSTIPGGGDNSYFGPWTARNRPNAVVPHQQKTGLSNVMGDLGIDAWWSSRPDAADLAPVDENNARGFGMERPIDVKYRLRPVIGRTVTVKGNVDVARALNMLNMKVAVNKIRSDVNKQRFHERPGLKRKRLRRERWRARFKQGFKATCSRVRELARQGW